MTKIFSCLLICLISFNIFSQEVKDTINLNEVKTTIKPTFDNVENKSQFDWLEKKLLKVYPIFSNIYIDYVNSFQLQLNTIENKREKKKFIKFKTKEFKEKYFEQLKSLTNYEGKILCKLIHKETNSTSYQIVKEYKGNMFANYLNFQTRFANIDLNEKFSPELLREDKYITIILQNLFLDKKLTDVKTLNLN